MANVKITDLTAYTDPLNTDVLPIVDVTNNVTKKVSIANLAKNVSLGTAALPGIAFDGDPNTGIYSPGADQVAISTGGTVKVTVDGSGGVLIGLPTARTFFSGNDTPALQVEGLGNAGRELSVTSSTAAVTGGVVLLGHQRSGAVGGNTILIDADQMGLLGFQGNDGVNMKSGAYILATVDGAPGVGSMPGRLAFATAPSGTVAPVSRLEISSTGSFSSVIPGGSTLYPQFACRAWVNFDGTGTVTIRGSGNVSSITDNGTGDYTVNFTSAMPDANFAVGGSCEIGGVVTEVFAPIAYNTASIKVATQNALVATDATIVNVIIFR